MIDVSVEKLNSCFLFFFNFKHFFFLQAKFSSERGKEVNEHQLGHVMKHAVIDGEAHYATLI